MKNETNRKTTKKNTNHKGHIFIGDQNPKRQNNMDKINRI